MSTAYSIGQMNQLADALEAAEYTPREVTALRSNASVLKQVKDVLAGVSEIIPARVIDCDADPFIPDGWSLEEHVKGGSFTWDPSKVELYLTEKQQSGALITGEELRKEIQNSRVPFNARLLDYLFAHQELIPKSWEGEGRNVIAFWGTLYRDREQKLCVRCLFYDIDRILIGDRPWHENQYGSLEQRYDRRAFAAVRVSD